MAFSAVMTLSIILLAGEVVSEPELSSRHARKAQYSYPKQADDSTISEVIMRSIDPKRIEENIRILSSKPHIAGRTRDFELVSLIQKHFSDHGLDVQTTPYDVLLSYPSNATKTSVRILDKSGKVVYDTVRDENDLPKDVIPPFNAYAPAGLVEGDVVYAGYGRQIEYDDLLKLGINVSGKIVIMKYGKIFRGSKVQTAQSKGAIGVILYSDPIDVTGVARGDPRVFPDTWWLPPKGVHERNSITTRRRPLNPWLSIKQKNETQSESNLPLIPCQPIGYLAAYNILRRMGGPSAPSNWTGGFHMTYRLGPGFKTPCLKLQLNVTNQNQRAKVENVFGIIKGSVEPDRYVMMGNHRDAWNYGAIDPSSGTAVMMEMSRIMGDLVKYGSWRPRRTVIFCSWGAEEYGLIGSTEYVEQYVATLRERAVSYINVDLVCAGNATLFVQASPMFRSVVYEASKKLNMSRALLKMSRYQFSISHEQPNSDFLKGFEKINVVPNPNPTQVEAGRNSVYDGWLHVTPFSDNFTSTPVPSVSQLGSTSDYTAFIQVAGVTSVDLIYFYDPNVYPLSIYPLYHSEFETFDAVRKIIDPDFKVNTAMARVVAEIILTIADSVVLPYNITDYAIGIERYRLQLNADFGPQLQQNVESYGLLKEVIQNFTADVVDFETQISTLDKSNVYALRSINDRIMLLERAFLTPEGLPLRPMKKHILTAESSSDLYSASTFPGLSDLLVQIDTHPERWDAVRRHFGTILQTIQSAGATLRDVTKFMSETL
ncbi:Aminopeptidase naaladl1 [Bulinus truncatus]|nr:Aminopeptidase naaladl1 [Bulinus truncatus]